MSHALVRNTWLNPRPYLLYLKPTARCDLRCQICQRWQEPAHASEEISTDELRAAHKEMQPRVVAFGMKLSQSRPSLLAMAGMIVW